MGWPTKRRAGPWLLAATLLLSAPSPATAEEETPRRRIAKLKDRLRTGSVEERRAAVEKLVAMDSALSILPLEEAVQGSVVAMDRGAKAFDRVDKELTDAAVALMRARRNGSLYVSSYLADLRAVQERWQVQADGMRGHLDVLLLAGAGFSKFRNPGAVDRIAAGAKGERDPLLRQMYVAALADIGDPARIPLLVELLSDFDARVRAVAARGLGRFLPRAATLDPLVKAAADRSWQVRMAACESLARFPLDVAVPALAGAMAREEGETALRVDSLLRSLTGASFHGDARGWAKWWEEHREEILSGAFDPPKEPAAEEGGAVTEATFFRIPLESRNVLILLDFSGSMFEDMVLTDERADSLRSRHALPKTRLGYARAETIGVLESLPEKARFNILVYHDGLSRFSERAQTLTPASRRRAIQWILAEETGAMTNIWAGLRGAFGDHLSPGGNSRFDDLPDTILFLTDGVPTNGRFQDRASIVDLVRLWNASAGAVVHCVGMGAEHDAELLAAVAKATGGFHMDLNTGKIAQAGVRPAVPQEERTRTAAGCVERLARGLQSDRFERRVAALGRLHRLWQWSDGLVPHLGKALLDEDTEVVLAAADALVRAGPGAVGVLLEGMARTEGAVDGYLRDALERRRDGALDLVPGLAAVLADPASPRRVEAAHALGALGGAASGAEDALAAASGDAGPLGAAAREALERIRADDE